MKNPAILSIYCVFEIYWKHYPRKNNIEIYDSLCRESSNIISTQISTIGKNTSSRASIINSTIPKQTSTKTSTHIEKTSIRAFSRTSTITKQTYIKTYTFYKKKPSFENKKIKYFKKNQLTNKIKTIPSTGKNNNCNTQRLRVGQ